MTGQSPAIRDALTFLARLGRLDPAGLVRIRHEPADGARQASALWAVLPWGVLVTRHVAVELPEGTVPGGELAEALRTGGPVPAGSHDVRWRWPLPAGSGEQVEVIPIAEVERIGRAAEHTLREVSNSGIAGRGVGERAVRDALLDHVPIVVIAAGRRYEVSQRLVQAVLRMGFTGPPGTSGTVGVLAAQGWVGISAEYGRGWRRGGRQLTLTPAPTRD